MEMEALLEILGATISPFTSVESVSQNTPPEASSLSFNELNPTKSTGLSINYTFF